MTTPPHGATPLRGMYVCPEWYSERDRAEASILRYETGWQFPTKSIILMEMPELLLVFLAGFLASFVDGALGMGFGPTSSTVLLSSGLSPAAVSSTVNLAKVATGITAAVAHWRFDNIDRRLVARLAVPGAVGAVIGVTVLANVEGDTLKPVLSVLLLLVAARILHRFSRRLPAGDATVDGAGTLADGATTSIVATTGGITNGLIGAWGPVVTPYLLQRGVAPRITIGSVNTAEIAVAVVASGSLLASVGGDGLDPATVVAMLLGGMLAAPIAAWSIRFLPARGLGIAVGALLFLTNLREVAGHAGIGPARWLAYGAALALCGLAAARPHLDRQRVELRPA